MSSNDRNKVSENAINSDVVKSMIATWEEEEYNRLLVGINSCDEYNCDISDEYGTSKLHIEDFNYGVEKTRLDITDKLMHSIDFSENEAKISEINILPLRSHGLSTNTSKYRRIRSIKVAKNIPLLVNSFEWIESDDYCKQRRKKPGLANTYIDSIEVNKALMALVKQKIGNLSVGENSYIQGEDLLINRARIYMNDYFNFGLSNFNNIYINQLEVIETCYLSKVDVKQFLDYVDNFISLILSKFTFIHFDEEFDNVNMLFCSDGTCKFMGCEPTHISEGGKFILDLRIVANNDVTEDILSGLFKTYKQSGRTYKGVYKKIEGVEILLNWG